MSAIKKIVILFNRDVELAELTEDFIKLSDSGYFGLTGKSWEFYSEAFKKQVSIPLGFIKLNKKKYDLFTQFYPEQTDTAIRMVAFENDWSDFHKDFIDYSSVDNKNSKNVEKLIRLLKNNLNYYLMSLFTYDYFTDCPHTDEFINMQLEGVLENEEGRCYLILDSPEPKNKDTNNQ